MMMAHLHAAADTKIYRLGVKSPLPKPARYHFGKLGMPVFQNATKQVEHPPLTTVSDHIPSTTHCIVTNNKDTKTRTGSLSSSKIWYHMR